MYERNRRNNRGGRGRRSRERTPPRQRSPVIRTSRDRSRPKFERNRSREKFNRRSREGQEPRFERVHSSERFEPPQKLIEESARFEPPPREILEPSRSFENERFLTASPRFDERIEPIEPPMVERNLNFECPVDYNKFPGDGRYFDIPSASNIESTRPQLESSTPTFSTAARVENNDKPDPWTSSAQSSTQLQPTFGQEKGSTLIPEFDPDSSEISVNAFLRLIDKIAQEKGWSSHDRKFQFSMKLAGAAKDWFVNGNKFLETWSSIKKQFRASFPDDMEYHYTLKTMLERTKRSDEDLSSYFNYKIALLRNCNISGRKAVSCLIGGLPDVLTEIKANALDKNFASAEDLYKYLIEQNVEEVESQASVRLCTTCGKRDPCDCHKSESQILSQEDNLSRSKGALKCYKDVYISGRKLKCLFDEDFPHNTIRESDIDFVKVRYRRQITIINGYDRSSITALGQTQLMVRIDSLFTEMPFYVVKDNVQEPPVLLGRVSMKFPHAINRNTIFFTADDLFENRPDRDSHIGELKRNRSPIRRNHEHDLLLRRGSPDRILSRSPRRSPPGRVYKDTTMFLNQFYGK